jgi:hypothetical protein
MISVVLGLRVPRVRGDTLIISADRLGVGERESGGSGI